jgi:hypothetical protein
MNLEAFEQEFAKPASRLGGWPKAACLTGESPLVPITPQLLQ